MSLPAIKKLGFGTMRLPQLPEGGVDVQRAVAMIRRGIDGGITYVDTAYPYHRGQSENVTGLALKDGYRERVTLTTKLACWAVNERADMDRLLDEQLKKLDVPFLDFYLLHALDADRYEKMTALGWKEFAAGALKDGRIRHIGFSFHGSPGLLEKLLREHPEMDFVQLQINYVDWNNELIASGRNYELARQYGKDIVVMEPVKGGILASVRPEARKVLDEVDPKASSASLALRFVASLPGVQVVLSGMSSPTQMADNLSAFADFKPLNDQQMAAVRRAGKVILDAPIVPCTACRYCVDGCPMHIQIPDIFQRYNMLLTFGEHFRPHGLYRELIEAGSGRAGDCIGCGQCEGACPQHIGIIEQLAKASEKLDQP